MAKQGSASVSAHSAVYTVFIDTNLDTHLAMNVSAEDTVGDLKKQIKIEHPCCFPNVGEIAIHALKVKRKGCFYHLSDSMLVKSTFNELTKTWFLKVDVSRRAGPGENLFHLKPVANDLPACVYIMDGPLAEKTTIPPDHPSKEVSILDNSSLPQVGSSQVVYQQVPPADQFCPGDTGREELKDFYLQASVLNEYCKSSSDTSKRSDSEALKKHNIVSKENEDPGTYAEGKTDKSKNKIMNMQCDDKSGEALRPMPAEKKRRKNEKKNDVFCDPMEDPLREKDVRICIASMETSEEENMIHPNFLDDKQKLINADSDKFSTRPPEDDHLLPTSLGTIKRKKKKKSNLYGQIDGAVASKETSEGENIILPNISDDKQKLINADSDKFSTRPVEDNHLLPTSLGNRTRKKKKKSSLYGQVDAAVPSSEKNFRHKTSEETFGDSHRNLGEESGETTAPEQIVQSSLLSNPSAIYEKEEYFGPVVEGNKICCTSVGGSHDAVASKTDPADVADSSVGIDMCEPGASKVESTGGASDTIVTSKVRKTKGFKKHHALSVKELNSPVVDELDNLTKDNTTLVCENVVPDDNVDADETGKTEKEEALSQNDDPKTLMSEAPNPKFKSFGLDETEMNFKDVVVLSKLLDASGILGTGDPGDKRKKKSKKSKDSYPKGHISSSGIDHTTGAVDSIPSKPESDKALISDHPSDGTKEEDYILSQIKKADVSKVKTRNTPFTGLDKEADDASGNVVGSLPQTQITKIQETVDNSDPGDERKKKSKKSKDSYPKGHILSSGIDHTTGAVDSIPSKPESDKALISDHPSDGTKEVDNILSQIKKADVSKVKTRNTPFTGLDKEADDASGNVVGSLPLTQITNIQETADNSDNKVKKKSKKTRTSGKNLPDPPIKEQDVSTEDPIPSNDEKKEQNLPSKKKKPRLGKTGPTNQLTESKSEAGKDSGNKIESSQPCLIPGTNEPSQIQSDIFVCKTEVRPHEAGIKDDSPVNVCTDKSSNHMEVPKFESNMTNVIDYIVPSHGRHEAKGLGVKEIQMQRSVKERPGNKKRKKLNAYTGGTSPDLQTTFNSIDNRRHKGKPLDDTSDTIQVQGLLSKDEQSEPMAHPNGRTSVIARDRVKAPTSHRQDKFDANPYGVSRTKIVEANRISVHAPVVRGPSTVSANTSMKENSADWAASSTSLESSDEVYQSKGGREPQSQSNQYHMAVKKASSKKMGEVLNSSNHEMSLLATSRKIFKDSSSENSEDGETNISEASTRSPSDSSSSSDYSEAKYQANMESPRNGLYGGKRKENDRKNLTESQSAGPKNLTLDMILRSSSSYKKAKFTASQSQLEDTENQPIDFVLDCLADP